MKTALKWTGWAIFCLIGLAAWTQADKVTQVGVALLGAGFWAAHTYEKRSEEHRRALNFRLTVIEQKLDLLVNQREIREIHDRSARNRNPLLP